MSKLDTVLKAIEDKNSNIITNSSFVGVQYDAKAIDAISLIAQGCIENAKVLNKLAETLKASNVTIESLLKVEAQ